MTHTSSTSPLFPSFPPFFFFFFNDTATPEIYTLSLHDALPIFCLPGTGGGSPPLRSRGSIGRSDDRHCLLRDRYGRMRPVWRSDPGNLSHLLEHLPARQTLEDRKSTRLNSSHANISYAVFCLRI